MEGVELPPAENGYKDDDILLIGQYDGCNASIISSDDDDQVQSNLIPVVQPIRRKTQPKQNVKHRNVKTLKRSNKVIEALDLPSVINLNPRGVYNKVGEFHTLVNELAVDLVFMSESWERENLTLDHIIDLDNYQPLSLMIKSTMWRISQTA